MPSIYSPHIRTSECHWIPVSLRPKSAEVLSHECVRLKDISSMHVSEQRTHRRKIQQQNAQKSRSHGTRQVNMLPCKHAWNFWCRSPVQREEGERKKRKKRGKEEILKIKSKIERFELFTYYTTKTAVTRSRRNAAEGTQGNNMLMSGNLKMNGHKKKSVG